MNISLNLFRFQVYLLLQQITIFPYFSQHKIPQLLFCLVKVRFNLLVLFFQKYSSLSFSEVISLNLVVLIFQFFKFHLFLLVCPYQSLRIFKVCDIEGCDTLWRSWRRLEVLNESSHRRRMHSIRYSGRKSRKLLLWADSLHRSYILLIKVTVMYCILMRCHLLDLIFVQIVILN
jgi:hypothetical protein